jgi:hypothetical protein
VDNDRWVSDDICRRRPDILQRIILNSDHETVTRRNQARPQGY